MIERRHPARERIRRLIGQVHGDAEAEMLRRRGHRRHQQQRIVDRDLRGVRSAESAVAAEHVVDAEHVGEKQPVEQAALQRLRQRRSSRRAGDNRASGRADGATSRATDARRNSSRTR
jgi:hypothetical protein